MRELPRVLVVDDDPAFREVLAERIRLRGMEPSLAGSGQQALELAAAPGPMDLAIVDLRMPGMDGLELLGQLRRIRPALPAVLLTGHGDAKVREASSALSAEFFDKGDMASLWEHLNRLGEPRPVVVMATSEDTAARPAAVRLPGAGGLGWPALSMPAGLDPDDLEVAAACRSRRGGETIEPPAGGVVPRLIGEAPAVQRLRRAISRAAQLDCPVLLHGEEGTGRELAARLIHRSSRRAGGAFVTLDCAAMGDDLLLAELFGRELVAGERGERARQGLLESSAGGTILLENVEAASHEVCWRLAVLLDQGVFSRLGGEAGVAPDVRIMAASRADLAELARNGRFDGDLAGELTGLVLDLQPLREHPEDIPLLVNFFLDRYRAELGKHRVEGFGPEAMKLLESYDFPGNVAELELLVEGALIRCREPRIGPEHLPDKVRGTAAVREPAPTLAGDDESLALLSMAELEDAHILRVMRYTGGNKNEAADILGISRTSLWRKLKKLGEFDTP